MNDEEIKTIFKTNRYKINSNLVKQYIKQEGKRYDNLIYEYISNRYQDSFSFLESLYRIILDIDVRPSCCICGKPVQFLNDIDRPFNKCCSTSCAHKLSYKNGITKESIEKAKKTRKETLNSRYGVDNTFQIPEVKSIIIKKHLELYKTEEFKEKKKKSVEKTNAYFIKKYGCNPNKLNIIKEKKKNTCLKKYGYETPLQNPIIREKGYITKKKNGTFSTSEPEEDLYLYIKEKFPLVERQYKCDRYPWKCDFYIPELDCFIEYNGFVTHGKHAYNPDIVEDAATLQKWKIKSKDHPLYKSMIQCWTISDVKKRNKAKENNLNYHEFWNMNSAKIFIDQL